MAQGWQQGYGLDPKTKKKVERQVRGMADEELASWLVFAAEESRSTPSEKYKAQLGDTMAIYAAEQERRENGGAREPDVRAQYLTDGERAALGLDDKDDNL